MIIYNVTIKVENSICKEWRQWMKSTHIPNVLATDCFQDAQMFHLVEHDDDEGQTFSIQFKCDNFDKLNHYNQHHAPSLKQETADRYGEKALSFRTILKEI